MAATEVETPVKMCLTVLEKKVRNLEKRKGKLDSYRDKLAQGEELNKDQLDAISKYNEVLQTLEFSRDLQKQFQSIATDVEKMQRKQAKKEKAERQQTELSRLQELIHLQTLLNSLGDEAVRERLKSAAADLAVTDDNLNQLDEFYQLIAPTREEAENDFARQVSNAAEHVQLYLDRSDRPVAGVTYFALHELIDRLEASNFLQAAAAVSADSETDKVIDQVTGEPDVEVGQQLPVQQLGSPVAAGRSEQSESASHLSSASNVMAHTHDVPATSFIPAASVPAAADAPWAAQNNVPIVASQTTALPAGGSGNIYETSYFTGVPPSQLAAVHHVETSSFAQQVPRQQRPLQDIVSSMQGSFHFLQESQIDLDNQSLLASVRTSNPPFAYSVANAAPSGGIGQYQTHHAESTGALNHASSPHHFTTVPPLYHPPTGAFYGAQHRASPAMTFADQHQSPYLVAEGSHKVASSADEVCPVPIPLPNEVAQGQSLTLNAFNAVELSNSAVNKPFAMNPNADVFRYEPAAGNVPEAVRQVQSGESVVPSMVTGSMTQATGSFPDSDRAFTSASGYDSSSNGLRGSSPYGGRQDNGYSRGGGGRGGGGSVYNSSRGITSSYSSQRGASSKSGGRGGNVTGVGGGAVSSSGQANYSRGGNRGRGFGHSARMQQHMAA